MADRPLCINHVEMIFQPGEREAARALFETLGFGVSDFGPWLVVAIDPDNANGIDNVMYASEPVPAQQRFEDALADALVQHPAATAALEHYRGVRVAHPQYHFHFGASIPTHEEWTRRSERIRQAASDHPLLKGRVDVSVFNPGDPGSMGPTHQTFVLTDILSTGTLQTGLIFEIQHRPNAPAAGQMDLAKMATTATYPAPETIV